MKTCSRCHEEKPLDAFSPRRGQCNACIALYRHEARRGAYKRSKSPLPPLTIEQSALAAQWAYIPEEVVRRLGSGKHPAILHLGTEEAVSIGRLALVKAARAYKPSEGPFLPYARQRIRCEIIKLSIRTKRFSTTHLDRSGSYLDDRGREHAVPDYRRFAKTCLETHEELGHILMGVPERTRSILIALYAEGLTLEACGARFGVTRERIRQIRDHAIADLRKRV